MANMQPREGDIVQTGNGTIFDAKGLIHPPCKVVAFPRFIPDPYGNRQQAGHYYRKIYSLSVRKEFLEKNLPQYVIYDPVFDETLCEIPFEDITHHYVPIERLQEILRKDKPDKVEETALRFVELLQHQAHLRWNDIGVSGSVLTRLHIDDSDIDPIVYGKRNCIEARSALEDLLKESLGRFRPYTRYELRALFDFRSKDTMVSFEDFVRTESRKALQGKFMGRDYFVRFVKDWNEVNERYGDIRYVNVGYARIEATIADDSESIFTPCAYKTDDVHILEGPSIEHVEQIASFRGRFCEQARVGETVIAQGKVEHVTETVRKREHFRLLLGNKPSDYMILKH